MERIEVTIIGQEVEYNNKNITGTPGKSQKSYIPIKTTDVKDNLSHLLAGAVVVYTPSEVIGTKTEAQVIKKVVATAKLRGSETAYATCYFKGSATDKEIVDALMLCSFWKDGTSKPDDVTIRVDYLDSVS